MIALEDDLALDALLAQVRHEQDAIDNWFNARSPQAEQALDLLLADLESQAPYDALLAEVEAMLEQDDQAEPAQASKEDRPPAARDAAPYPLPFLHLPDLERLWQRASFPPARGWA